jgi:hypothetical protein
MTSKPYPRSAHLYESQASQAPGFSLADPNKTLVPLTEKNSEGVVIQVTKGKTKGE